MGISVDAIGSVALPILVIAFALGCALTRDGIRGPCTTYRPGPPRTRCDLCGWPQADHTRTRRAQFLAERR